MALNDERYGQLFQQAADALDHCNPPERAMMGFLGGMLSEIRSIRFAHEAQLIELKAVRKAVEDLAGALNRDGTMLCVEVDKI